MGLRLMIWEVGMVCNNCNKSYTVLTGFIIQDFNKDYDDVVDFYLCSPSCLVEWAWKIKGDQQKMSKSKDKNEPEVNN